MTSHKHAVLDSEQLAIAEVGAASVQIAIKILMFANKGGATDLFEERPRADDDVDSQGVDGAPAGLRVDDALGRKL